MSTTAHRGLPPGYVRLGIWLLATLLASVLSGVPPAFAGKREIRELAGWLAELTMTGGSPASLPAGLELLRGDGFVGVRLGPPAAASGAAALRWRPAVWTDEVGLLDAVRRWRRNGRPIAVALNGTFFAREGPVGQVIVDGGLPAGMPRVPWRMPYPRCFIAELMLPDGSVCTVIGETGLESEELLASEPALLARAGLVRHLGPVPVGARWRQLLGGGGWLIRAGADVHRESHQRQRLRFQADDRDTRRSVVALTTDGALVLAVFREGRTLPTIVRALLDGVVGPVDRAIFVDGGSSSCLVQGDEYLFPPVYLVDRARFTALVIEPEQSDRAGAEGGTGPGTGGPGTAGTGEGAADGHPVRAEDGDATESGSDEGRGHGEGLGTAGGADPR